MEEETISHLHVCPGDAREKWRKETLNETKKKLCALETPFPIQELFLKQWPVDLLEATHG